MLNYKWKLCNGQTQEVFDHFKSIVWYEENQLNAKGLIQNIEEFYLSPLDAQLTLYAGLDNINSQAYKKYEAYWRSIIGNDRAIPLTTYYIQQYIEEANLINDFNHFLETNYHRFINYKSKQEILETLIDKIVQPLFQQSRGQYFFIYRDKDNKGLFITRPNEKDLGNLLELLNNFIKLLSHCIVNYDPEKGSKKEILDMIKKISSFKEIYYLSSNDYKTLINILDRIKMNLRRSFNPNPFLVELNAFIDDVF